MPNILDRAKALELLHKHTKTDSLIRHALSVEGAMRHFAVLYGEDADYWGIVGLLHDLDYEEHPEQHCQFTPLILRENGYDEEFIHAILTHGYGLCTDVKPEKQMEKVIYTIDELTGFISACALMRPSKSVMDMEVSSVKKKFKTLNFAAAVNRTLILEGAAMMGMEFDVLVHETIMAMRAIAESIGL